MNEPLRPHFWQNFSIDELTHSEWEALCDGCGLCCLIKLEDEDTSEVAYTNVACKLLDCQTGQCQNYPHRRQHVPDCLQLTPESLKRITWLPSSCAYRRIYTGQALPNWHYLITDDRQNVIQAKKSVARRCISETAVDAEDIENHIVRWVR